MLQLQTRSRSLIHQGDRSSRAGEKVHPLWQSAQLACGFSLCHHEVVEALGCQTFEAGATEIGHIEIGMETKTERHRLAVFIGIRNRGGDLQGTIHRPHRHLHTEAERIVRTSLFRIG